ncbi:nuclear transport factor 2 family protein [Zymomonas sp.]|uniref:nuclear transport factor 2 family protein n=1 Tax=Zymomonas sp. TaxID=2068624 RepID=UPI0025E26E93|nr:nuclear transport factor 2 family protein [Zymomonas sp.]MCA1955713.1 hypothetical protein [Zymomonas sp.]
MQFVHENCVFEAQGPSDVPIYGQYNGHEGVIKFLSILSELFDTEDFKCLEWLDSKNYVFGYGYMQHRVKKTGKLFKSEWALVCKIENNLIISYKIFEDTAALQSAYKD